MYRLIESIKVEDGLLRQTDYHNRRFNEALMALFPGVPPIDLREVIHLPTGRKVGIFKLRLLFDGQMFEQELIPYTPRIVKTIRLVTDNRADYCYKTENRTALDNAFAQRNGADDIIIVKNNHLTDSFAANLVFFDGHRWVTSDTPLLKGTQRAWLLDQGLIEEIPLTPADLNRFSALKLINAMIGFDEAPSLSLPDCLID